MIRTVKAISCKVLGANTLDFSELTTLMAEVEATVNNRPLACVSSDPDSYILTPNLLIRGEKSVADPALSPPQDTDDPDFDLSDALNWLSCRIKLTLEGYRQWRSPRIKTLQGSREKHETTTNRRCRAH